MLVEQSPIQLHGSRTYPCERDQIAQARALVSDLFDRRPGLYWLDFGITAALTWTLVAIYFTAPAWSWLQLAAMLLAAIGLFRAGTFMHEIVHFRQGEMTAFKHAWNLLFGYPFLTPWVMYRNHIEHHSKLHFGTPRDAEYLPLAAAPPSETVKYMLQVPLLPVLGVIRFGLLGPLSRLHGPFRAWLLKKASASAINPYCEGRLSDRMKAELERAEWFCFGWLALLFGLTVFGPIEAVHWLMAWALLGLGIGLNWLRNLAAHGYGNSGDARSQLQQLDDSINLTGQTWLTCWFFPVGLRYHALHHLFPGMPYHQLGKAHRRLIQGLPADHPYHHCNHENYFRVVASLVKGAWQNRSNDTVMRRWKTQS